MATTARSGQLTQAGVTGAGEWDSRLNRLLEDLQETVIPTDSRSRNAQEYREYRVTQRTQVNDEPPQTMDEKWVEIGNLVGGGPVNASGSITDSAYSTTSPSRFTESKSVAFADQATSRTMTSSSSSQRAPQIEYLAPANLTTELKSGPSSPTGYGVVPSGSSHSPKIERKEFYSKASYTTMIKGQDEFPPPHAHFTSTTTDSATNRRLMDELMPSPSDFPPILQRQHGLESMSSSSETKKTYMTSSETRGLSNGAPPSSAIGAPLYSSTPMKPSGISTRESNYSREIITDRGMTPPPQKVDPLKTPPMIRKILQSSQKDISSTSHHHHHTSSTSTTSSSKPPPVGGVPLPIIHSTPTTSSLKHTTIPSYDEPPERIGARYYTSTVTTEHRERDVSPIRRFPSPQSPKQAGEPPKRLDELLATFEDSSYRSTTSYGGSDGAHKSVPYGPGSHPVRSVRIDDNVTSYRDDESSELIQRKNVTQYQNPSYGNNKSEPLMEPSRNIQGPPVFYPPGQMFTKTDDDNMKQEAEQGKGKPKADKKRKENDKLKSKHKDKAGEGAVPVPVCLPVCCAAPCSIM